MGPSAWSPSGNKLAYTQYRYDIDTGDIYTINPDGTDQRQLTNLPGDIPSLHWSPESNRIVFEFDPASPVNNVFCEIAMMNRNGGALKIFPVANGDACEASPSFSADGHRR